MYLTTNKQMAEVLTRDVFISVLMADRCCFGIVFNMLQVSRWLQNIVATYKDKIANFYCEIRYDDQYIFHCLPNGLKHGTWTQLVDYCSYSVESSENYSYGIRRGHQFDKVYDSGDGMMERTDRWYGGDDGKNITTINRDYDYDLIRISNSRTKYESIRIKIKNNVILSVKRISTHGIPHTKHYISDNDWPINTEFETLLKWSEVHLPVDSKC